jgi:hypothetical protein
MPLNRIDKGKYLMAIALLPRSFIPVLLTPEQKWALNFGIKMNLAGFVSIVTTGISILGFGLTDDHGLPADQKNGKVKNVVHKFFTGTLALGASATIASVLGVAYASYIFHQIK